MGRKPIQKNRPLDENVRQQWIESLVPFFIQNGFHKVTTNDIAEALGVSKATLYEHFESRDEIFAKAIEHVLDKIREKKKILEDERRGFQERYVHVFSLILQQLMGMNVSFLDDLKSHYPELWSHVQDFFRLGSEVGEFKRMHPAIMSRSVITLLRELINPEFLLKNDVAVNDVFIDLFRMHTGGVFPHATEIEAKKEAELAASFQKILNESLETAVKEIYLGNS